jgi:hypothetical protein
MKTSTKIAASVVAVIGVIAFPLLAIPIGIAVFASCVAKMKKSERELKKNPPPPAYKTLRTETNTIGGAQAKYTDIPPPEYSSSTSSSIRK